MSRPAYLGRRAWASLAAALFLWAFVDVTKHSPVFAPFAPFDVDPYDVVTSFTFQIAVAIAAVTLVRLSVVNRQGRPDRLSHISRGIAVVAVCIALTMASDTIAIVRAGVHRPRSEAEAALWAAIAALSLISVALTIGLRTGPIEPSAAGSGEFDGIFRWPVLQPLDPQRHAIRFGLALALSTAVLATAAEIVFDGPAPTLRQTILVIIVRIVIETAGVFVGVMLLGRYLGLLAWRRPLESGQTR